MPRSCETRAHLFDKRSVGAQQEIQRYHNCAGECENVAHGAYEKPALYRALLCFYGIFQNRDLHTRIYYHYTSEKNKLQVITGQRKMEK